MDCGSNVVVVGVHAFGGVVSCVAVDANWAQRHRLLRREDPPLD